nr:Chain A, Nucleoprotein GSQASS [Severe acute respiratory syndrome coronavirus 2]
GSQASS